MQDIWEQFKEALDEEFYTEEELETEIRRLLYLIRNEFLDCKKREIWLYIREDHEEVLERMRSLHNMKNKTEIPLSRFISDIVIPRWLDGEHRRFMECDNEE